MSFLLLLLLGRAVVTLVPVETAQAEKQTVGVQELFDAVNSISETFALWDDQHRLVMCNRQFQDLYKLSDEVVTPGRRYEEIMAMAGRSMERHNATRDTGS